MKRMKIRDMLIALVCFGLLLGMGFSQQAHAASKKGVVHIQTELQGLGYFHGKMTGLMDKDTTAAVKAFQKDHGLKADGVPGKKTRVALRKAVQQKLKERPAASGKK
jgi:peptidoglycan hydrolase-like protein with peptidoglycan-binding domain